MVSLENKGYSSLTIKWQYADKSYIFTHLQAQLYIIVHCELFKKGEEGSITFITATLDDTYCLVNNHFQICTHDITLNL